MKQICTCKGASWSGGGKIEDIGGGKVTLLVRFVLEDLMSETSVL